MDNLTSVADKYALLVFPYAKMEQKKELLARKKRRIQERVPSSKLEKEASKDRRKNLEEKREIILGRLLETGENRRELENVNLTSLSDDSRRACMKSRLAIMNYECALETLLGEVDEAILSLEKLLEYEERKLRIDEKIQCVEDNIDLLVEKVGEVVE